MRQNDYNYDMNILYILYIIYITYYDPFPLVVKDDLHQNLSNMDILKSKIDLKNSILTDKEREAFYQVIYNNRDVFSMRDEIITCSPIQVYLKL